MKQGRQQIDPGSYTDKRVQENPFLMETPTPADIKPDQEVAPSVLDQLGDELEGLLSSNPEEFIINFIQTVGQ